MGKYIHRIKNVDAEAKTATCAHCGPGVAVRKRGTRNYWFCVKGQIEGNRSTDSKRYAAKLGLQVGEDPKASGCVFCGYNKCRRSLHFHHVNPKGKLFNLGAPGKKTAEEVKEEVRKCLLVCANCHGEIHNGIITADQVLEVFQRSSVVVAAPC